MTATIIPDHRTDQSWNQCIACHGVRISRFFCRACLDAGVSFFCAPLSDPTAPSSRLTVPDMFLGSS